MTTASPQKSPAKAQVATLAMDRLCHQRSTGFVLGPISTPELHGGDVWCLWGLNGAGKSTLLRILAAEMSPTSGLLRLNSQPLTPDAHVLRRQIGYLPQDLRLPPWSTAQDLLQYAAALLATPDPRADVRQAMSAWGLDTFADRPLGQCSFGMQKRVGLALATIHHPQLLILDEPQSGLDLEFTLKVQDLLQTRRSPPYITVFSSHSLYEGSEAATHASVLVQGRAETLADWSSLDLATRVALTREKLHLGPYADRGEQP